MLLKRWTPLNLSLLGLLSLTIYLLGQSLLNPRFGQPQPYPPPTRIFLPGWELRQQGSLPAGDNHHLLWANRYEFQQQQTQLTAEVRYFITPEIPVDNSELLKKFTLNNRYLKQLPFSLQISKVSDLPGGQYFTFIHQGKAYLSSCIAHDGYASTGWQDYNQRRFSQDLTPARIIPWWFQSQPLLDTRCVWSFLSTPVTAANPEAVALRTLRQFWQPWSKWWRKNYPRI